MAKTARVIVASNRAAAGTYDDHTGPLIAEWLRERHFVVTGPNVVPDGEPVGAELREAVADSAHIVLTTGGTGINPNDQTPEVTAAVLDYPVSGLADAIRAAGLPEVPTAVLSRGLAGVSGRTLIVNLPGSRGGVQDGLGVLDGVLEHALHQIAGGDHARAESAPAEQSPADGEQLSEQRRGAAEVITAEVTENPVAVAELDGMVRRAAAGAVVTFSGVVRDHDDERGVRELEYVSHPTAEQVISEVAAEIAGRFAGVRALAVRHRVGLLGIGDVALGCAVAAEHRGQAFSACSELVDEVKRRLPVWKRQVFTDNTEEWVNCP